PAPGWRRLLDEDWPVALQGVRASISVVVLLFAWIWLELPDFQQMAITVAVVMAAPGAGGAGVQSRHAVGGGGGGCVRGCLGGGASHRRLSGGGRSSAGLPRFVDRRFPAVVANHRGGHVDLHAPANQ